MLRYTYSFFLVLILFLFVTSPARTEENTIITVLDFSTEGVAKGEMNTIIYLLSSSLFQTGKYTVIDISQRQTILKEMEFSISDCSDESCLLEIGKMLSAEVIVVGNIGRVGTRYVLSTKILETETAKTLNTADGIYKDLDALLDDIDNIVNALAGTAISETSATEESVMIETDKPVRPRKSVSVRRIAAFGSLAGTIGLVGTGSYFIVRALTYIIPMNNALDDYNNAAQETEENFAALYDTYLTRYDTALAQNANGKLTSGIILGGVGLALGAVSTILFLGSDTAQVEDDSPALSVVPSSDGLSLNFSIGY